MNPTRFIVHSGPFTPPGCYMTLDSPYALAVLADSPKGYWQLQECPTDIPADTSGNAKHMTFITPTPEVVWRYPGALTSPNDAAMTATETNFTFIGIGGSSGVSTAVNNITFECFYHVNDTTTADGYNQSPIVWIGSFGVDGWSIYADWGPPTYTTPTIMASGSAGGPGVGSSSSVLTLGAWYHVVVCRDAGTWKTYLNGTLDVSGGTFAPAAPTDGVSIRIGNYGLAMSHVAYYDVALSAGQVATHYAAR